MITTLKLCIVIPCYNETNRLKMIEYRRFLRNNEEVLICFVDDGSTDQTAIMLQQLQQLFINKVVVKILKKNQGKAAAVREGMQFCYQNYEYDNIAFLDADLSTSLSECLLLHRRINASVRFVFGSRIAKIDTRIDRKTYRFIIGRVIATLISKQLGLSVYDTQCGCKVMDKKLASYIFRERFISKWLFDVEIFHRLLLKYGKNKVCKFSKEVPLKSWIDTDGSKVELWYVFKLWIDLINIKKRYKNEYGEIKEVRNEMAL